MLTRVLLSYIKVIAIFYFKSNIYIYIYIYIWTKKLSLLPPIKSVGSSMELTLTFVNV